MTVREYTHQLTDDERKTLLFLTGGLRIINCKELSKDEIWNLKEFFGYNRQTPKFLMKVIIKRDEVITKVSE